MRWRSLFSRILPGAAMIAVGAIMLRRGRRHVRTGLDALSGRRGR